MLGRFEVRRLGGVGVVPWVELIRFILLEAISLSIGFPFGSSFGRFLFRFWSSLGRFLFRLVPSLVVLFWSVPLLVGSSFGQFLFRSVPLSVSSSSGRFLFQSVPLLVSSSFGQFLFRSIPFSISSFSGRFLFLWVSLLIGFSLVRFLSQCSSLDQFQIWLVPLFFCSSFVLFLFWSILLSVGSSLSQSLQLVPLSVSLHVKSEY